MERSLAQLEQGTFDVLVVGGGILGACTAWDAALRGLRTALVEARDFAGGASWNSLKIVHGGLRYLQTLDLGRVRTSTRERATWLRIAPHLVEPVGFVVPIARGERPGRLELGLARRLNDLLAGDRNRGLLPERRLPPDRLIDAVTCRRLVPNLADRRDLIGGFLFHDGLMYSPERLVLEVVAAAAGAGAVVANHIELDEVAGNASGTAVALLRDDLTGEPVETRARLIVNAAGGGAAHVARLIAGGEGVPGLRYMAALNLVVGRPTDGAGFALSAGSPAGGGARRLFVVPWRGATLIGTAHFEGPVVASEARASEEKIEQFLEMVNRAWPTDPITRDEVRLVHHGLLPRSGRAEHRLDRPAADRIFDHGRTGDVAAITALSAKFTTGRRLAERVVDLGCEKLGIRGPASRTAETPLPGAYARSVETVRAEARTRYADLPGDVREHLIRSYGERYEGVLGLLGESPDLRPRVVEGAPVIRAQLVHAIRNEMACRPEDLLLRRTELGSRGLADDTAWRVARGLFAESSVG